MVASDAPLPTSGIHLVRVDYGYGNPPSVLYLAGRTLDLSRTLLPPPHPPGRRFLPHLEIPSGAGLLLRNADRLLAWGRLRGRGDRFAEVCEAASRGPVILLCRFPRHANALRRALEDAGAEPTFQETPRDGSIPPLYRNLDPADPRIHLHVELEWVSAMAAARGDAGLEQVGLLLAAGPQRGSALASTLGITQGAARSYLQWMEDVALVRQDGRLFSLAHPLLGTRFKGWSPAERPPFPRRVRSRDDMSVD